MLNNNLVDKAKFEEQLHDRWSWISEDIDDDEVRLNTELVLESSYKYMVSEDLIKRGWLEENILSEDVITEAPQMRGAVGDYVIPKVMFPIIRRVMEGLIANKLVSVQPIQQPTGVMYYITYDYSDNKGNIRAGDEFSMNPQQTTPAFATWYSSEKIGPYRAKVTAEAAATGDINCQDDPSDEKTNIKEFLTDDPKNFVLKRIEIYNRATGEQLPVKSPAGAKWIGAETPAEGEACYDPATGHVHFNLSKGFTEAEDGDELVVFVVYDQEGSSLIPEMEFHIDHQNVDVKERKLKVRWTKEAEQDMMAYHKIDVEQELVKVASVQTNYEIDREIMTFIDDHIIAPLSQTHNWADDEATFGNNTQGNYLDRHRCLAQKMYQACTKVATFNHLGPCDWAVCSPKMAAVLQMLPDWKAGEIANAKSTFYNAGALGNGSLAIYVDPNRCGAQEDEITLGYKSKDSTYGAGVVYSPYANWMSGTVINPDNFNNVRGFFSRYGLTMAPRGEYNYARVRVDMDPYKREKPLTREPKTYDPKTYTPKVETVEAKTNKVSRPVEKK